MTKRRIAITAAAVVLVVGVVAGRERPTLELIQERAPRVAAAADDGIDLERLQRNDVAAPKNDPFSRKGLLGEQRPAPAPAAAVQQPAPKPVAPPLPFKYFGKLIENGKLEMYVMRGDELLTLARGQSIGEYRVEDVSETAIAFTYLPLNTKQTLDLQ